jgi:glycerophosphoryl diester phosphodiesterase
MDREAAVSRVRVVTLHPSRAAVNMNLTVSAHTTGVSVAGTRLAAVPDFGCAAPGQNGGMRVIKFAAAVPLFASVILVANAQTPPLVIAHRGASGYVPEHTLEAYALAIRQGADYIEPDLVMTRDGVLVARHENEIGGTTNVADLPQFAARRATKVVDGLHVTGWFTEDFTLAELKTLHARERLPKLRAANTRFDGQFRIPTFEEVLQLAGKAGRTVGVYPETKHPTYFRSMGLGMEEALLEILTQHGHDSRESPVFIQSFETGNLRALRKKTRLRLIQLMDADGAPYDLAATGDSRTYADLATPKGLAEIAIYADGVGVHKSLIIPRGPDGVLASPTRLVADAHAAGLLVHGWTFRAENEFLPKNFQTGGEPAALGHLAAEVIAFLTTGMDGFFTDHPDVGVLAREAFAARRRP